MGWKRIEKEFRKTGKSVENETKRFVEKINDELDRFAERRVGPIPESGPSSAISQLPEVAPVLQPTEPVDVPIPPTVDTNIEEIIVNPENLQPGRAFLINHLTFNDVKLRQRTGSEVDVDRLERIFLKFGMDVNIVNDGTLADVRAVMNEIRDYSFQKCSCLVIVIMSHGFEKNMIAAKDGTYSLDYDVMYRILQNTSLTSKLKFIVTEGCKGTVDPRLEIEGPLERPTAIPSEILQVYSCVEGYVSYLSKAGSIFINIFCDHLEEHGLKKSILDIANAVVADVNKQYLGIQIPMVHTNLTKKFVFGHYIGDRSIGKSSEDDC